jgi:hypothetical protein
MSWRNTALKFTVLFVNITFYLIFFLSKFSKSQHLVMGRGKLFNQYYFYV